MKNSPLYQAGAIGFTISNGVPKVGQLLNSAWDLTEVCRFKIITIPPTSNASSSLTSSDLKDLVKAASSSNSTSGTTSKSNTAGNNKENADRIDMPPPPSPASSTCSDTGSVTSHKRAKRTAPKEEADSKKDEEQWLLKDVVFVEDTRSIPIGRILKVDGHYAAVRFPSTSGSDQLKEDTDAWQDCRLMKKDDLQLVKSATTSRIPDCFQKTPRRIAFSVASTSSNSLDTQQLLTIAVDNKGVHAIIRTGSKLHYCLHNMNTGRLEYDSVFPTDTNAFLGLSQSNISLTCANETADSVLLLRDGNSAIYPLVRDCLDAIRDPHWFDLPPIRCLAATTLTLNSVAANMKSQIAILALVPETQLLMQRILRCDFKGFKNVLNQIEVNADAKSQLTTITNERCDGNRNIVHACVAMCSPSSNKDNDETSNTNHASQSALDCNIEFSCYQVCVELNRMRKTAFQ